MDAITLAALASVAHTGPTPLFATVSGAHLYGFASRDSDIDLRGAFVLPLNAVPRLREPEEIITITQQHNGFEGRYRFPHTDAERAYRAALAHWDDYQTWRRHRNPERAELEARYGYDTKHAMHLFRLLRMGEEILREGVVRVLRPDAEWLLGVRDGSLAYEKVVHMASKHEANLPRLVEQSSLPSEPDTKAAEALLIDLQETFLFGRS